MFKYSMMSYTVARQMPENKANIKELCKLTRELGLDAIDFVGIYGNDPHEVRTIADDYGLKVICYTFFTNLHEQDPALHQANLEAFKNELEVANILGTKLVMLPCSEQNGYSRDELRAKVIHGLKDAVQIAKAAGIVVSIEHYPRAASPFVTAADVNEALSQIPELRLTYDNGNCLTGGDDPCHAFLASREKIVFTHFKDWGFSTEHCPGKYLNGKSYAPELIGRGIIDYTSLMQTMKDSRYQGYINIEYEGNEIPASSAIREALDFLRQLENNLKG